MKSYSLSELSEVVRKNYPDIAAACVTGRPQRHSKASCTADGRSTLPPRMPSGCGIEDVLRYLNDHHPKGTRSAAFHIAVWLMHDAGFDLETMEDMIGKSPCLSSRYPNRLPAEIRRSLSKPRPAIFNGQASRAPLPLNRLGVITLAKCPRLPDAFMRTLERHGSSGVSASSKILDTCRAIESVAGKEMQAVVMLPCGLGKSTWAKVHIATSAGPGNLYIMVVQNRDTVFHTASQLRDLMNGEDVGVYVGWKDEDCVALSGRHLKFKDCLRDDNHSACRTCIGRDKCHYYVSRSQLRRNVVVMTRESFLVLCEKGHDFSGRRIIVDEALLTFADETFSAEELDSLQRLFNRYGCDPVLSGLLKSLFPSLEFGSFAGVRRIPDAHIRRCVLTGVWDSSVVCRIIRFIRAAGSNLEEYEPLVFRFLLFFRTAAMCGASYAYTYDGKELQIKKDRLDLRSFTAYRSMMVLDATAALSLSEFAPSAYIYACPDLDKYARQGSAKFYVVVGNPTKRRRPMNIEAGINLAFRHGAGIFAAGPDMMLPINNDSVKAIRQVETALGQCACRYGVVANVRRISRGRLRGTNEMIGCMSAFMPAASYFSTLEDLALHAALRLRRDIPWSELRNADGSARMHHGRFMNDVAQDIYMRKAITELYQGIYRTAIRDGRDVSVILAVPDAGWLVPLWQLMRFTVVDAAHDNPQAVQMMKGISELVCMVPGSRISKRKAAICLGYRGRTGWRDHRGQIKELLYPFFRIPGKGKYITRRRAHETGPF